MPANDVPHGWRHNPSLWPRRLPGLALALVGLGIATYLGLFQLDLVHHAWEPFFGDGTRRVVKESIVVRLLEPVPDALIGAFFYLIDFTADMIGGRARWRTMPWMVLLLGVVSCGLAVGGIGLTLIQAFVVHAYCTLCLGSAACSILIFCFSIEEVVAASLYLWRQHQEGRSTWQALWGKQLATR